MQLRGYCQACNWLAPSDGTKRSTCGRVRRHAVAVGCDTCSCMPRIGHATGPPSLSSPPPTKESLAAIMFGDMQLRSGAALTVAGLLSGLQRARPSTGAPFNRTKMFSCGQVIRHAITRTRKQKKRKKKRIITKTNYSISSLAHLHR